jgi:hypothetical protein
MVGALIWVITGSAAVLAVQLVGIGLAQSLWSSLSSKFLSMLNAVNATRNIAKFCNKFSLIKSVQSLLHTSGERTFLKRRYRITHSPS